jgi:predicted RNase H-like HicB family nuclease
MKKMKLPVIITRDEDGYYLAEVPVLQSCFTQGKTKEEAISNIKEVIQLYREHLVERLSIQCRRIS